MEKRAAQVAQDEVQHVFCAGLLLSPDLIILCVL